MTRLGPLVRLVTVGLFAAVLFAGIAVALQMCVRLPRAHGAPLPPPPKLSVEILVGKWVFEWGALETGTIWVYSDGSYCSTFGASKVMWHGDWAVRDGALELTEWRFDPETQSTMGPMRYRVKVDMARFPAIAGRTQDGTRVVLRDPER